MQTMINAQLSTRATTVRALRATTLSLALLAGVGAYAESAAVMQASVTQSSPVVDLLSAKAWRGWKATALPVGWKIDDEVLSKEGPVEDIILRKPYANFELELQWKISAGGNSGLFFRGTRDYQSIYSSAPEYQLLDDENAPDGRNPLTSAAAAYALYPRSSGAPLPAGDWNTTRLIVNGAHVEHWLNGHKVVTYELWSADWKARVAASKFAQFPRFGLAQEGMIGIQGDHPGALALRGIRIRELTR
jgi:Domain of Unknown Function (DUF1080)